MEPECEVFSHLRGGLGNNHGVSWVGRNRERLGLASSFWPDIHLKPPVERFTQLRI